MGTTWLGALRELTAHAPPEDPSATSTHRSEFFRRPLPGDVVSDLVDLLAADRVPGATRTVDLMPWAGAYNRVPPTATAFAHRHEQFLLKHAVSGRDARWLDRSWRRAATVGTGRVYPNFPDLDLSDPGRAHYAENLDRLVAAKRRYDPDGVLPWAFPDPSRSPISRPRSTTG